MHYLAGTDSVHTTAAICDYLDERATGDDTVTAIAVVPPDDPTARRDGDEALNVAPVRLATVGNVATERRSGPLRTRSPRQRGSSMSTKSSSAHTAAIPMRRAPSARPHDGSSRTRTDRLSSFRSPNSELERFERDR